MALIIPTTGIDRQQDLELTIEGVSFVLRFQWLERLARWAVDFLRADGEPVLASRALIPNRPLNDRFTDEQLPDGLFVAVRRDGTSAPFGLGELSSECLFFYLPSAELAAERPARVDAFGTLTFRAVP